MGPRTLHGVCRSPSSCVPCSVLLHRAVLLHPSILHLSPQTRRSRRLALRAHSARKTFWLGAWRPGAHTPLVVLSCREYFDGSVGPRSQKPLAWTLLHGPRARGRRLNPPPRCHRGSERDQKMKRVPSFIPHGVRHHPSRPLVRPILLQRRPLVPRMVAIVIVVQELPPVLLGQLDPSGSLFRSWANIYI